jgi:hypothetical protein
MSEVIYIVPEKSVFNRSKGGFLTLRFDNKEYGRVSLHRAFPFSHTDKFISVRDKEGKEIGIIRESYDFAPETVKFFEEELNRRYFLPLIKSITALKEEFGYSYWEVMTDIGFKKFIIKKDNSSFINLKDNRILIADVDGNRYEISDYLKLDSKSYKLIELML